MIYRDEDFEHGMLCESCEQPFREGDEIYSGFLTMTANSIPIIGDNVCPRCFALIDYAITSSVGPFLK